MHDWLHKNVVEKYNLNVKNTENSGDVLNVNSEKNVKTYYYLIRTVTECDLISATMNLYDKLSEIRLKKPTVKLELPGMFLFIKKINL